MCETGYKRINLYENLAKPEEFNFHLVFTISKDLRY